MQAGRMLPQEHRENSQDSQQAEKYQLHSQQSEKSTLMYSVLVLAASFLIQMLTSGVVFTYGVLLQPVQTHFSTSQTTAAWLGSIQMFVFYISGQFTCTQNTLTISSYVQ